LEPAMRAIAGFARVAGSYDSNYQGSPAWRAPTRAPTMRHITTFSQADYDI